MKRITPQVKEEHIEYIQKVRSNADSDISDAEAIRRIFDQAIQCESQVEHLESELNQAEARIEELRSKLVATTEKVDASNELVRIVEEEQSLQKQRAQAGVLTRAKWWVTGMPSEDG
jgi:septal ring factor EnvC (AmiA/AmiB activator)